MKLSFSLSAFAALCATATAAVTVDGPVDIEWSVAGTDCTTIVAGESIMAGKRCKEEKCGIFVPDFTMSKTCGADFDLEAARVFKDTPYSIIEVFNYRQGYECEKGNPSKLVARGDGECYPVLGLTNSARPVTLVMSVRVKIAADNGVSWTLFKDSACKSEIDSYAVDYSDVKSQRCVGGFMRVLHSGPARGSTSDASNPAPTTKATNSSASADKTPEPAKTAGAASISTLGVLATCVVLVASAALY